MDTRWFGSRGRRRRNVEPQALHAHHVDFLVAVEQQHAAPYSDHGVALAADCDWFVVRKAPKDRGTRQQIEGGVLGAGTRVLMVEDTITTGGSTLTALEVVRATGAEVVLVTALVDRGDTAAPAFAAAGVTYSPLLTWRDVGIDPVVPPA